MREIWRHSVVRKIFPSVFSNRYDTIRIRAENKKKLSAEKFVICNSRKIVGKHGTLISFKVPLLHRLNYITQIWNKGNNCSAKVPVSVFWWTVCGKTNPNQNSICSKTLEIVIYFATQKQKQVLKFCLFIKWLKHTRAHRKKTSTPSVRAFPIRPPHGRWKAASAKCGNDGSPRFDARSSNTFVAQGTGNSNGNWSCIVQIPDQLDWWVTKQDVDWQEAGQAIHPWHQGCCSGRRRATLSWNHPGTAKSSLGFETSCLTTHWRLLLYYDIFWPGFFYRSFSPLPLYVFSPFFI